ncbi:MAG: flagellar hook-associated protein FlgL [Pseudomonadales bacterium]
MRVTTQQQYLNSIDNMQRSQSKINNLSEQIASGKKIMQPSDDPVAAAQIVKLERELAQYDKYELNIDVTQKRLELQESVLAEIKNSMNRVNELIISGNNGTLTDADRDTIANSMRTEVEFMAGLMNTQDAQGEYIFSGSKGTTQPYVKQTDGSYQYMGDDGQRSIQVTDNLFVPSNDSGDYLFESITGRLEASVKGAYAATPPPAGAAPLVTNVKFDNVATEKSFQEKTRGLGDLQITTNAAGTAYSITDSTGNPVKDANGVDITNIAYTAGDEIDVLGMKFNLAAPSGAYTGNNINTLQVQPEIKNILTAVQDIATAMEKPITDQQSRDDLSEAVTLAFDQVNQSQERNIESVTRLGTRLSFLDQVESNNVDFKLFAKTSLSSIQDANLDEVISLYKLEEVTLQASQQIFGRVSSLSLFNYLQN